jgi:XTP/dITP diphosphohydrolase
MPVPFSRLMIATKNKGKLREFASLFSSYGVEVLSLHDAPNLPDVEENCSTFAENAWIKASAISALTGLPVLADDSGLCVDRLDGEPGVFSARYGGEHGNDGKNNTRLLQELANRSDGKMLESTDGIAYWSSAKFVCALVLYYPWEQVAGTPPLTVEGECQGLILPEPRGTGGFGYDPLFYIPRYGRTMAELTMEEKNSISHRSKALQGLVAKLG